MTTTFTEKRFYTRLLIIERFLRRLLVIKREILLRQDPRHLVLLRGYSLKERPPSPAPPPVPDIQGDVYP